MDNIFLLIVFVIFQFRGLNCQLSGLEPFCEFIQARNELLCANFTQFDQLNFKSSSLVYSSLVLMPDLGLNLKIDSNLDLTGLSLNYSSVMKPPRIQLSNLFGFDPNYNPFLQIKFLNDGKLFNLEVVDTEWLFNPSFDCSIKSDTLSKSYTFSDLNINELLIQDAVFFNDLNTICPLIFKNTIVKKWIFFTLNPIHYARLDNQINASLNITVDRLEVKLGYDSFVTELNNDNLLNELIFNKITHLEFRNSYIQFIDGKSLQKFQKLKHLKLLNFNLRKLFQNGSEWINSLNTNLSSLQPKREDLFELTFSLDTRINNYFQFDDLDLCIFKKFPHTQFVIPLVYIENFDLSSMLPCSCTIYWLYKNYNYYSGLIKTDQTNEFKKSFPFHCLDINPVLLNEQLEYCENEDKLNKCEQSSLTELSTTTITTKTFVTPICLPVDCTCFFEASDLNLLECTSPLVVQVPSSFESPSKWSYVSFKGSSIKELHTNSFNLLNLQENATVLVSQIHTFYNDIFINGTIYKAQFRFVIENSLLESLEVYNPFRFTNFSQFELKNCSFGLNDIPIIVFEGSIINTLIINQVALDSISPFFKTRFMYKAPQIKKFKLLDIYDTFSTNSPIGLFGLDFFY